MKVIEIIYFFSSIVILACMRLLLHIVKINKHEHSFNNAARQINDTIMKMDRTNMQGAIKCSDMITALNKTTITRYDKREVDQLIILWKSKFIELLNTTENK